MEDTDQRAEDRKKELFLSELEMDMEFLINFKYPAIPTSYQKAYSTPKPIETVTKYKSFYPKMEWYTNYLKRKVTGYNKW